jgi:GntR family transcriptional regulator, transcriptional repressor for pyruvate dehydrogenase complex
MIAAASTQRVRFERIQQIRAHESVAEQIRRQIELRLIGPGEALPAERELAAMFGVGRATIRHALRLLEQDHLVETRRGRLGGTFVTRPAENSNVLEELILRIRGRRGKIQELLVYRSTLEPGVAGLAAATRGRDDLAAMRRELAAMATATSEPDYMRSDTGFHLAVARATGNGYFIRAIEEIRAQLNDAISLLPETDAWHSRISEEHDAILEAIQARDETAAEAAMALHIAASDQGIRAMLEVIRRWRGGGQRRRKEERR